MIVLNLKILGAVVPENCLTQISQISRFSFTQYTSSLCRCIQNLKNVALIGAEKSVTQKFIGKKKNKQIRRMISIRKLILSYTIQQDILVLNICIKFQIPRCSNFREILDTNFPTH